MTATLIDLFASALHIHPEGDVRAGERRMAGSDSDAWQVATFRVESDGDLHADHWEMHPEAEEAVCCLTGGVRLYFRPTGPDGAAGPGGTEDGPGGAEDVSGGDEEMVRLREGTAVIVPRGRWHRLELDVPSDLMSITLRRGTRLEKRAEERVEARAEARAEKRTDTHG